VTPEPKVRICFVCWGNICRSPTAEGIMRALVEEAGLGDRITVESAGTSSEELGNPVDRRAVKEAAGRGITLEHTAWQFRPKDFDHYDMVLVADTVNLKRMRRLARDEDDLAKLRLLRELDPDADPDDLDVPDPWYGGHEGFVHVYDLMEAACRALLEQLR
jgi:protein-tyrosine phosphatase